MYSGLNLNQDKATKPQTVQTVRQGEATPYWFKVNPLYSFRGKVDEVGNLQYIKTDYAQSVQTAPPCSHMRFKPLPVENHIKFIAFQHFPDLLDFFGHQHDFCIL